MWDSPDHLDPGELAVAIIRFPKSWVPLLDSMAVFMPAVQAHRPEQRLWLWVTIFSSRLDRLSFVITAKRRYSLKSAKHYFHEHLSVGHYYQEVISPTSAEEVKWEQNASSTAWPSPRRGPMSALSMNRAHRGIVAGTFSYRGWHTRFKKQPMSSAAYAQRRCDVWSRESSCVLLVDCVVLWSRSGRSFDTSRRRAGTPPKNKRDSFSCSMSLSLQFMESLHDSSIAHWDHESWRSGVSAERRNSWEQQPAALCRDAATGRRFMESRRGVLNAHYAETLKSNAKIWPALG